MEKTTSRLPWSWITYPFPRETGWLHQISPMSLGIYTHSWHITEMFLWTHPNGDWLKGNFLLRDFPSLGCLATHSCFKGLWELTDYYQVQLTLSDDIEVPPLCERDKVVMEEANHLLPATQWVPFNRAHKFFQVHCMSQLILSDEWTVDSTALTLGSQRHSSYWFP